MLRKFSRTSLVAVGCVALGLISSPALAQTAYGVTSANQLVRFSVTNPATFDTAMPLTGLGGGETLVGLDFRPTTGQLFGLGSQSRLYVIDTITGAATQVGTSGSFTLSGSFFGFDFNPTVDRIRVVSDADQNIRLNPASGALAAPDAPIQYAVGDPNQGVNPSLVASAYTNSFAGASTTTLYGIDSGLDVLVIQNPANNGTLTTVGSLNVNPTALLGFDILATPGGGNAGYAALHVGGVSGLYQVNLATGNTTLLGSFPGGAVVTGLAVAPDPPRLANISTRAQVLTGNDVMIAGFVIGGSSNKTVVVRARGPSLIPFGVTNALLNPQLQLVRSSDGTTIASNDDWATASNAAQLTASGFAPSNSLESAILINLAPGAYTAIVSGVNNITGVGIAEVFEVDATPVPLVNISTRAQVLTGNDVMIGGFVIAGSGPQTVVVRARGPSLAAFGIANPLANPQVQLVRSSDQVQIAYNDNWQDGNAAAVTASGFAPMDPLESAIFITLNPGAYTAIVTGVGGGTGVGIVEVFTASCDPGIPPGCAAAF